jgi:hypothetical protein
MFTLRQFRPIGPAETEMWAWYLVWKGMPEDLRELSYRIGLENFSNSGIAEQDDAEPFQTIARAARSAFARKSGMRFNFQMGLEGIGCSQPDPTFPGPGVVYWPRYEEGIQRSFYRRWLEFMTSEEYPESDEIARTEYATGERVGTR